MFPSLLSVLFLCHSSGIKKRRLEAWMNQKEGSHALQARAGVGSVGRVQKGSKGREGREGREARKLGRVQGKPA